MMPVRKYYYSYEKNLSLKIMRGVDFTDAVTALKGGGVLGIMEHPNKNKYPGQRIFVLKIKGYIYAVLFVEFEDGVFLKTLFPSRKLTKQYLNRELINGYANEEQCV